MGRYISGGSAGGTLTGPTGPFILRGLSGNAAIAGNDLLSIAANGQLFPATTSDYASVANSGGFAVAPTTVTAYGVLDQSRKIAFANSSSGDIFIATAYLATSYGMKIFKYSSSGALLASLILETSQVDTNSSPAVQQLSDGNLLVTWALTTTFVIKFMIFDTNLNIIQIKTTIANALVQYHDVIPLSSGGFAVCYMGASSALWLAIYDNTGTVVSAGTAISGSPVSQPIGRLAQMSNGNIFIGINSAGANKVLGYAINTNAGTQVASWTALDATTGSGNQWPEVIALPSGYVCTACFNGTNTKAFVLSNAGVLQGGAYSRAQGSGLNKLLTDGTNFWLCQSGTISLITYIPITGTGFFETVLPASSLVDAALERGYILYADVSSGVSRYLILTGGYLSASTTITNTGAGTPGALKLVGDFAMLLIGCISSTQLTVQKYINTAIVGIAQTAVAVNTPNTAVLYNEGPGGFTCNRLAGSIGKSFDHTVTTIVGNKGTLLGTSVTLKGI